jgi:gamma-glutamyl phosphate reductase
MCGMSAALFLPAMSDLQNQIVEIGRRARDAARILARSSTEQKNRALRAMADEIDGRAS